MLLFWGSPPLGTKEFKSKRNILGDNARRLFNLEPVYSPVKLARRAAKTGRAEESGRTLAPAGV